MNVLFVDQFGELGGAQLCLLDLIPPALAQGWKLFAAVPEEGELADRLVELGVEVTRIETARYRHGRKSVIDAVRFLFETPRLALQIRALCRKHEIGLLYVNGPRMMPAAVLSSTEIPILFHAHSVPAGVSRHLVRWATAYRIVTLVAVSNFVASCLASGSDVHVVGNGVKDLHSPRPGGSVPRVGMIGRIAPEKGQLLFVNAARSIPNCEFVICGSPLMAGTAYMEQVRSEAAGLPFEFMGWRSDIGSVLAGLDLLVVPSAPHEGFCRAVIEAFSAGVPVVAFPSGGIPELIQDGTTGFLVEPQTAAALAQRIVAVLHDVPGRERIVRNARAAWESGYTLEKYTGRMIELMARAARPQDLDNHHRRP